MQRNRSLPTVSKVFRSHGSSVLEGGIEAELVSFACPFCDSSSRDAEADVTFACVTGGTFKSQQCITARMCVYYLAADRCRASNLVVLSGDIPVLLLVNGSLQFAYPRPQRFGDAQKKT